MASFLSLCLLIAPAASVAQEAVSDAIDPAIARELTGAYERIARRMGEELAPIQQAWARGADRLRKSGMSPAERQVALYRLEADAVRRSVEVMESVSTELADLYRTLLKKCTDARTESLLKDLLTSEEEYRTDLAWPFKNADRLPRDVMRRLQERHARHLDDTTMKIREVENAGTPRPVPRCEHRPNLVLRAAKTALRFAVMNDVKTLTEADPGWRGKVALGAAMALRAGGVTLIAATPFMGWPGLLFGSMLLAASFAPSEVVKERVAHQRGMTEVLGEIER